VFLNSIEKYIPMTVRIGVIIFAGMLCAGCASPGAAPKSVASEASPGSHTGLRAYKDPRTGEFTDPPATEVETAAPSERALNRSHEGLMAVPNDVPGGGVRLDLQGRFRSHFIATKDSDGKVSIRCLPEHELPKP
jgi:hypothetical protein